MLLAGLAGLAGLVLLPLIAALGFYGYYQVSQRIAPNVTVGETRVGNLTLSQAAILIHKEWNLERRIVANSGLHSQEVQPEQVGLAVDPLATAQQAYQFGHGEKIWQGLNQLIRSLRWGQELAPVVTFDPEAARRGLESLAPQFSQAPQDAGLQLVGTELEATPPEYGHTINIDATVAELEANADAILISGTLPLALRPVAPQVEDVSAAMQAARRLLDAPVAIRAYDPLTNEWQEWRVPREAIAGWIQIEASSAGPQVAISERQVAAYLDGQSGHLGAERYIDSEQYAAPLAEAARQGQPLVVTIKHHPTTYTVQSGDTLLRIGWNVGMPYWMILKANPGLDPDTLRAGQQLTIPSKDQLLPYPVVMNKRIVISITDQRLWTYENGELRSEHVISTGIDRSPTQPGIFQVQTHEVEAYASVWDLTMPHFIGIYEAWPGFMNGLHGLPTLSNGRRLWGNILGRPASYGCIILDLDAAENLFHWAEKGVVVEIQP